jgi:hypothetical protein
MALKARLSRMCKRIQWHKCKVLIQATEERIVKVLVCGSGLTRASVMQSIGMKSGAAARLATAVVSAENKIGVDKRKLFDCFEGMVKVDLAGGQNGNSTHGQHAAHVDSTQK